MMESRIPHPAADMVDEWLRSEAEALELRFASVVDADRAGLVAIGERHEQISQLGVGALRGDETGDVVVPIPAASLASDRERRLADVGQGEGAVTGHGRHRYRAMDLSLGARRHRR